MGLADTAGNYFATHRNETRQLEMSVLAEGPVLQALRVRILLGLCEGLRQRSVSPDAYGVARK